MWHSPLSESTDKMTRPTTFTEEVATLILDRIAQGEALNAICREPDMPTKLTIYRWLDQSAELQNRYVRATELRVDHWSEDILTIADDEKIGADSRRLRVDTRKWLMSKVQPKKYGDRMLHTGADGDGPIKIKVEDAWARPVIEGAAVVSITDQDSLASLPTTSQPIDTID